MHKRLKRILFLLIVSISLIIIQFNPCFAGASKKVLIIHSYEKAHICGQPQHDGAIKALNAAKWAVGKNLKLSVYHMDTKRKNNTPKLIKSQAKKVLSIVKKIKPDVILTLDDNAFRTVALPLAGSNISIVFCGMNGQPETYNIIKPFMKTRIRPGSNITGVYEKLHIREAIQVLSNLLNLEKVLILDDLSPTGKAISIQVKLELDTSPNEKPLPCKIEKKTIKSWEQYKKVIKKINTNSDIDAFYLGTLLLRDHSGKTYTAKEIIDYALKYAKKPAIGLNYAFIKMGLYGGASVDFFSMGYQAGKKVAAILNGTKPGDIPIQDAQRVALVFNLKRAKTLGLKIPDDILLSADEVFRK
jgi:ABC-type uncharacterized transport system substrate-binding protein